jgi:DNA-directed RNA polymerase specialized sigma24 family protein
MRKRRAMLPWPTSHSRSSVRQEKLTSVGSQVILTPMVEPAEMVAQTASEDPEVGLRGVASLRALLEAVEELQVRRARELGWSRQQIAELLGVSKQAVHQKYGKADRRPRRRLR